MEVLITSNEVSFKTKDGITLYSDIYEYPKGRNVPLRVLFHQGGGDARVEGSSKNIGKLFWNLSRKDLMKQNKIGEMIRYQGLKYFIGGFKIEDKI